MSQELEYKILEAIKQNLAAEERLKVTLDSDLLKCGFDSMDAVEFISEIETSGIVNHVIPDEVASTFRTGRHVLEYINNPQEYIAKYVPVKTT